MTGREPWFPTLQALVANRAKVRSACLRWEERGKWEFVPEKVVQRSLDADNALLRWLDENEALVLGKVS